MRCVKCGNKISLDDVYCTKCGLRNAESMMDEAAKFLDKMDFDNALKIYLSIIELDHSYAPAYLGPASIHFDLGDYENASNFINKFKELAPDSGVDPNYLDELTKMADGWFANIDKNQYIVPNPTIEVSFYESMPGRLSLDTNKNFINGFLELAENEIIIHKKSFWRGKDRGEKAVRYDEITSVDYDAGKLLALPSIQIYLSSVEYTFQSGDKRLKSFFDMIRERIDRVKAQQQSTISSFSPMDEIKKAKELLDAGAITPEEFQKIKEKYLNNP